MEKQLLNKKVLVMVANGVDESAMSAVQRALIAAGASVKTAGMEPGLVNSWNKNTWGLYFPVDQQISLTLGADFDCLVVPAGSRGVQKLATSAHSERIISSFLNAGKPAVFMDDAEALLEKVGGSDIAKNDNVLTGPCENMDGFVADMLVHMATREMEKVAA